MALFTRFPQKLFGSTAGVGRIAEFGSLSNGSPVTYSGATATPSEIQALANFNEGLDGSLVAGSTTPIQDMNALHFLETYQLGYLMQQGIAEYDSATVYNSNSLVMSGQILYMCIAADTVGIAPTSSSPWALFGGYKSPTVQTLTSGSGTYTTPAGVKYIKVRAVGGGGGGGGNGTPAITGSTTSFGGSLAVANGGALGPASGNTGAGGSASVSSPAIQVAALQGGYGAAGNSGSAVTISGGSGGNSALGGGGAGAYSGGAFTGTAGRPNTGGGGGGGYALITAINVGFSGGGSGGYTEALIYAPSSTYAYVVGAGGSAGVHTGTGLDGGAGGAGIIIVEEFYS